MTQLMDYASYLAKEIGPRPAGTEEEQQAALYITEQFQKEAGFTSSIEEFPSSSNLEGGNAILAGIVVAFGVLAMIFPVLSIPAFILAAAAAAVYTLEAYERPVISRVLSRGASQNVIAKYQPNPDAEESGRTRTRKIVLVAHYDSGRVTPGIVKALQSSKLPIALICIIGMIASAVFLFFRIFVAPVGGGALVVLNVLSSIALLICLVPLVTAIMTRTAPYNEGANNNASGTAALIEIARRISRGSVSEADLAHGDNGGVSIHGEQAAREAGLVPEGAQLVYEAEQIQPPAELGEYDEEERLLAAKAAIAALTGKPVEQRVYGSVADKLVNSRATEGGYGEYDEHGGEYDPSQDGPDVDRGHGLQEYNGDVSVGEPVKMADDWRSAPVDEKPAATDVEGFQNAPSWFVAAQQNAKRPIEDDASEVQRSRYAEALDRAAHNRAEQERAQIKAEMEEVERQHAEAMRKAQEDEAARAAIMSESLQDAQRSLGEIEPVRDIDPMSFSQPINVPWESQGAEANLDAPAGSEGGDSNIGASGSRQRKDAFADQQHDGSSDSGDSAESRQESDPSEQDGRYEQNSSLTPRRSSDASDVPATRASHARVTSLPAIDRGPGVIERPAVQASPSSRDDQPAQSIQPAQANQAERAERLQSIRVNVPSLSGVIRAQNEARQNMDASLPSMVNMPTPVEDASTPARRIDSAAIPTVGDNAQAPRLNIPADDPLDYDMPASIDVLPDEESGAPSGAAPSPRPRQIPNEQESVTLPKSRADGLFSRFRSRSTSNLEETPQEWLNVDKDFDARSVGRARGSWESFRDDSGSGDVDNPPMAEDASTHDAGTANGEDRAGNSSWQGGAYSRMQLGHVDMRSGVDAEADEIIPDEPPDVEAGRMITGEIEQIYHFRNPLFKTEIWFVAIGSDTESHDGAKAFLEEHRDELRGSMIVEVESLGVGALSVASREGKLKKVSASSRIKRYTRDAIAATGMAIDEVDLSGTDSIASIVQKAGFQSMHLFGAEDGRPALKGSADDLMENLDELLFDDNVNFVFELLKHQ